MTTISALQLDLLAVLAGDSVRLRWHSYATSLKCRGRGQVLGIDCPWNAPVVPSYTVRHLIRNNLIEPVNRENRRAFGADGEAYRDYSITHNGRRLLASLAPRSVYAIAQPIP